MSFELRDYQAEARDMTYTRVNEGLRPIVCAATGSGKTVIAAHMALDAMKAGRRVLWMTGREEILRQAYGTFAAICGIEHIGILMRDEKPWWLYPEITVASWHTMRARWERSTLVRVPADVLLVDEAHLSLSTRLAETVMPFYQAKTVIGFTATPARRTGLGLGNYYSRIIQVRSIPALVADGFLAPCEYWAGSHVDTAALKVAAATRDYKEDQLAHAALDTVLIGDVIENWARLASDRHTIVFAVNIAHGQALVERFKAAGVGAEIIHSKLGHDTRQAISDAFRNRDLQVLVNVGICIYGYDVPSVNCVVLARPTKSIVLHHQMIGRGIRPKPDGDYCMVLDHADNVRRLGCIDDEIRWTLDERSDAAHNTTRDGDHTRAKKAEGEPIECGNASCKYVFRRSRICPKCGWEKPVYSHDIASTDAELVQIARSRSPEPASLDRMVWYQRCVGSCNARGYKFGAADHAYKEKFGEFPPADWRTLPPLKPDVRVNAFMQLRATRYKREQRSRELK